MTCKVCNGVGWLYPPGDRYAGLSDTPTLVRCQCKRAEDQAAAQVAVASVDGLAEHERTIWFDSYVTDGTNQAGFDMIRQSVLAPGGPAGFAFISGPWGIGKTHLAMAACNEARRMGWASIYTTAGEMLVRLRATFDGGEQDTYAKRWAQLQGVRVLVLDELSTVGTTAWATGVLEELISARYRRAREMLTILCSNWPADSFTPLLRSRLLDYNTLRPGLGTTDFRRI